VLKRHHSGGRERPDVLEQRPLIEDGLEHEDLMHAGFAQPPRHVGGEEPADLIAPDHTLGRGVIVERLRGEAVVRQEQGAPAAIRQDHVELSVHLGQALGALVRVEIETPGGGTAARRGLVGHRSVEDQGGVEIGPLGGGLGRVVRMMHPRHAE